MFMDPVQRALAIGVWATSFSVGAAIGPLAGGVLLEFFWCGSVFLLAVPVMALLLVLGPVLLPAYRDPEAGRLDLITPPAAHRDPQAASPRPSSRYRKPFPAVSDSRISCYRKRRTVSGGDKYGYQKQPADLNRTSRRRKSTSGLCRLATRRSCGEYRHVVGAAGYDDLVPICSVGVFSALEGC